LRTPAVRFVVDEKKIWGRKMRRIEVWLSARMDIFSPLLARQTIVSTAFFCGERGPHPRAGFKRRRRDAPGVIEHQPKLRIQFAPPPGLGNLHQTA
jgi:hypothetical protein